MTIYALTTTDPTIVTLRLGDGNELASVPAILGGGGGGPPSGPAGGALTGTYPNPGVNVGAGILVTGVLPAANQAPQVMGGDSSGFTNANVNNQATGGVGGQFPITNPVAANTTAGATPTTGSIRLPIGFNLGVYAKGSVADICLIELDVGDDIAIGSGGGGNNPRNVNIDGAGQMAIGQNAANDVYISCKGTNGNGIQLIPGRNTAAGRHVDIKDPGKPHAAATAGTLRFNDTPSITSTDNAGTGNITIVSVSAGDAISIGDDVHTADVILHCAPGGAIQLGNSAGTSSVVSPSAIAVNEILGTVASVGMLQMPWSNFAVSQMTVRNSANAGDYNVVQTGSSGGDTIVFGDLNANCNVNGATINLQAGGNITAFNNGNPSLSIAIPGGVDTQFTVSDGKRQFFMVQQTNDNAGPHAFSILAGTGFSGSPGQAGSPISVKAGTGGAGAAANDNGGAGAAALFGAGDGGIAHGGGNSGAGGNAIMRAGNGGFAGTGDTPGLPGVVQLQAWTPAQVLRTVLQADASLANAGNDTFTFGDGVNGVIFNMPVSAGAGLQFLVRAAKGAAASAGGVYDTAAGDGGTTGVGGQWRGAGGFGGQAGVAGGSAQLLGKFSTGNTDVLVEAVDLSATRRHVALCQTGGPGGTPGLASANAPTGDGTIFIFKAQTSPTAATVNGGQLYVDTATGNLTFMGTSGVARLVALA